MNDPERWVLYEIQFVWLQSLHEHMQHSALLGSCRTLVEHREPDTRWWGYVGIPRWPTTVWAPRSQTWSKKRSQRAAASLISSALSAAAACLAVTKAETRPTESQGSLSVPSCPTGCSHSTPQSTLSVKGPTLGLWATMRACLTSGTAQLHSVLCSEGANDEKNSSPLRNYKMDF